MSIGRLAMKSEGQTGVCELCRRGRVILTRHHLIPRACHGNKRFQKRFRREVMQTRVVRVCHACHKQIHAVFTEKQLAAHYHTLERLLADTRIQRFVAWIQQKSPGYIPRSFRSRSCGR